MAYITYEEYVELGGMLDAASFAPVEVKAEGVVNWYTFNRLVNDETFKPEVKKCMAQLIDLLDVKFPQNLLIKDAVSGKHNKAKCCKTKSVHSHTYLFLDLPVF